MRPQNPLLLSPAFPEGAPSHSDLSEPGRSRRQAKGAANPGGSPFRKSSNVLRKMKSTERRISLGREEPWGTEKREVKPSIRWITHTRKPNRQGEWLLVRGPRKPVSDRKVKAVPVCHVA